MSVIRNPPRPAVKANVDIDNDVALITRQIRALRELAAQDDEEPISENQRYDFSIRWGTVLTGRLRRLRHYSSLGRLDVADLRRLQALRDELGRVAHLIERFRLAHPESPSPTR